MFNLEDVESNNKTILPKGLYNVELVKAEDKQTKSGHLMYVFDFVVLDGEFKGRHIFQNYIMQHSNDKVQLISKQQIKGMMECMGYTKGSFSFSHPSELCGKKCAASVKIEEGKDGYDDKNVVSYYKPLQAPKQDLNGTIPF